MSTANRGVYIGPPRFKIAVHSIVWLAKSGRVLSSAIIANQVDSHATFLRRVMQSLATAGIVESRGGRDGGYVLMKKAEEITLGEIYVAVKAGQASEMALDVSVCKSAELLDAELEIILHEVEDQTISCLRNYTVAYVMNQVDFFSIKI